MSGLLLLIAFLCIIGFIVGMVNPALFTPLFRKQLSRGILAAIFFAIFIAVSYINGAITPHKDQNSTAADQTASQMKITSTPTATSTPTSEPTRKPVSPTPTATPIPTDVNGFPMDAEAVTIAQIAKTPSAYDGKKLIFTCRVSSFAKNEKGDAAALNCDDPNDFSSIVQVTGSLFDMTKINQDDTVKIYGLGSGAATGKNAFGADVTEGIVDGLFINDLTTGYKNE